MRRQPSPADGAGKTKLVEPFGIVVGDAPAQNLPFPGIGGNLKPLQLAQHIQRRAFTLNLRPRRHMLPAQKPAHELCRGNRLNLLAQSGNSQAGECEPATAAHTTPAQVRVARAPPPAMQRP